MSKRIRKTSKVNDDLYSALCRLLEAYQTDALLAPSMSVKMSWDTNGQAISQARNAITKAEGK